MKSLKQAIQGVDIPLPTTPEKAITSEIGLNMIDLRYVQLLMSDMLHPEKALIVNKILQNIADSMNTLVSLTSVTEQTLQEALAQRNAAVQELIDMTNAVQQIDQSNPDVAALVLRVWTDAQADILQQLESQKGA